MGATIEGRITHRRALGKHLVFFDVNVGSQQAGSSDRPQWVEVVVRKGVYGNVQAIRDLKDTVKLGDVVTFSGTYESPTSNTLAATSCQLLQRWADANPGVAFVPQQAPYHRPKGAAVPSKQQLHSSSNHSLSADIQTSGVCSSLHQTQDSTQQQQQQGAASNGLVPSNTPVPAAASAGAASLPSLPLPSSTAAGAGAASPATAEVTSSAVLPSVAPAAESAAAFPTGLPPPQPSDGTAALPQLSLCKFWINSGRCAKGDACPWLHSTGGMSRTAARKGWEAARRAQRLANAVGHGHEYSTGAADKSLRAQLFCEWLLTTYGRDYLNSGAGVVDVAGGRGAVTFLLQVKHGVKVTLVDPRPFKLSRLQLKELQQLGCRTLAVHALQAAQLQQPGCSWEQAEMMPAVARGAAAYAAHSRPAVVQNTTEASDVDAAGLSVFDDDMFDDLQVGSASCGDNGQQQQPQQPWAGAAVPSSSAGQATPADGGTSDAAAAAATAGDVSATQPAPQPGSVPANASSMPIDSRSSSSALCQQPPRTSLGTFRQVVGLFDQQLWSTPGWQNLLGSCSLVLGMHPDEATEGILEYALETRTPFAVVPCCVFARLYTHRRYKAADGQLRPVVLYPELVDYLLQRGGAQQDSDNSNSNSATATGTRSSSPGDASMGATSHGADAGGGGSSSSRGCQAASSPLGATTAASPGSSHSPGHQHAQQQDVAAASGKLQPAAPHSQQQQQQPAPAALDLQQQQQQQQAVRRVGPATRHALAFKGANQVVYVPVLL